MKRVEANDPVAIRDMGLRLFQEGNHVTAIEYFERSAELGDADAHYQLSNTYMMREGAEEDEKGWYHLEEAAIRGHPQARLVLGLKEGIKGSVGRAVKHLIIAANLGHDDAIRFLREGYKAGDISKDDFAAALRAHHAAVNATKSPNREIAKAIESLSGEIKCTLQQNREEAALIESLSDEIISHFTTE